MNLTPAQKSICQRILNVFETGTPEGDYANISIFEDGPNDIRQITYGRSQTTEYGNLRELINQYANAGGEFSSQLAPYVPAIGRTALVDNPTFKSLLKRAGRDPVMRREQDIFFDRRYFDPAIRWANQHGFTLPLSALVIYDSFIHSGGVRDFLRALFAELPPSRGGDEKTWISEYVRVRHHWLANHQRTILHATVYRTNCFKREIARNNWELDITPINANGTPVGAGTAAPEARPAAAGNPDQALLDAAATGSMEEIPLLDQLDAPGGAAGNDNPPAADRSGHVQTLIELAKRQFRDFGHLSEDDRVLRTQIQRYWDEIDFEFPGVSTPWSAVFVSWCMKGAGATVSEFKFSTAHSRFVFRAIQNQVQGIGVFRGKRIEDHAPKPGDIIQNNRGGQSITYSFASNHEAYQSHSAIVVELGEDAQGRYAITIGGNESDTVGRKRVSLNGQGKIIQRSSNPYICVIENLKQ